MINHLNNKNSPLIAALMNYCDELVTVKDLNFNYLDCNQAFLNHLNLTTKDEVVGKSIFELLTPTSSEFIKQNLTKILETQKPQVYKFAIHKNGSTKVVQQTSTPIFQNDKIKYFLAISRDVTEDELMRNEILTKNSQLRTLLEYVPMLIYMKDENRNYVIGSKYAENFVKEGIDYYADNLQIDISLNENETIEEDEFVLHNKQLLTKEKCAQDYNGANHWYNIIKAPIIKDDNSINGIVTIAQNIDKYKELQNQKDIFIATLVHDLKNPLLAQISCLDLFHNGYFGDLTSTQIEMLEIILESANYMKEMLYTIINTYKYDNGSMQLNRTETDIESLIKTSIKEHSSFAQENKIKLNLQSYLADNEKIVNIDGKQIRRVISNLLNNGINYAYQYSVININLSLSDNNIIVVFESAGPPIDDKLKEHIFEKYISGKTLSHSANFGLGMYLSQKVMEAHGGTITLDTNENYTIFTLGLPQKAKNFKYRIYL